MPLSLQQLAANKATGELVYGGETVHFSFYPARITEKTLAVLQSRQAANVDDITSALAGMNDALIQLLASWDVVEDITADGVPGPMLAITADNLARLPIAFRVALLGAIIGSANLGEAAGTALSQPSAATTSQENQLS